MQKTMITGLLLGLSSLALAQDVAVIQRAQEKTPASDFQQGYELKNNQMPDAYNAPARIKLARSWNAYLSGSFIYWQPKEGGLSIATIVPTLTHVDPYQSAYQSIDFHPGFKVSLGFNSCFDDWNTDVEYTRLHTHDVTHFTLPSWGAYFVDFWNGVNQNTITTDFKVHYDMLAWTLGRYFYNGKNLSLKPNLGLKGGWIDQYLTDTGVYYTTPTDTVYSHYKSTSWLIGPRFGVDSKWLFGQGFRLFGDADFSLLYQHFNGSLALTDHDGAYTYRKNSPHDITANIGLILGLGWGSYFSSQRFHFDLSAAYEFQYYFHQNCLLTMMTYSSYMGITKETDLMFQGLTIKTQFDF